MTVPRPARRYRFGAYEVDAATGELRKQGIRIRLHAQPFQVLLMLMERPGELLTREEISRELWPDGTFVDYEHGVNSAVNRIRDALGDRAGNPRFVETLARRGYRFVAPVELIGPIEDAAERAGDSDLAETVAVLDVQERPRFRVLATVEELPRTPRRVVRGLFLGLQLMYLGFYVGALGNLAEIEDLFAPLPHAGWALAGLVVTAAILIPVRAFVLCAVLLHAPGAGGKFLKMWPFLLAMDVLWALSPFLLLHHINWGLALACTGLLVYSPFAQRSLVLMGAAEGA